MSGSPHGEVYGYDIVATHKDGRRIRPFVWTNDRNERKALSDLKRVREDNPAYRLVLEVRYLWGKPERLAA